ncbi:MAG: hypothetical protein OQL17_06855, partial [Sedimenticola sp.]|nr:hypothetical protein [Sedimenticola sp.]
YKRALEAVGFEAHRLAQVVDGLLTLARAEAGASSMARQSVGVDDLIFDTLPSCHRLASPAGITVDVEVEFSNPEDIKELLAGYSADVEIILETKDSALRIPTEAVIEDNQVYIFLSDTGSIEKREIEVGLSNWDYTEVLSGIKQGDQIITSVDVEGLEDGALAKAKESKKQ